MIQTNIKFSSWSIGLVMIVISSIAHAQTELQRYVDRCKSELNFYTWQVPREINCLDGSTFAKFGRIAGVNDSVVAYKINDQVDMVSACRWRIRSSFLSEELIIHNRETGGTCFFAAKEVGTEEPNRPIPSTIPSPVHFPTANNFWMQPTDLNNRELPRNTNIDDGTPPSGTDRVICVDCHSQGPYIASIDIAPYLAQYGLINDGHDINVLFDTNWHYYAVGSNPPGDVTSGTQAFKAWNTILTDNLYYPDFDDPSSYDCSTGCHQVARYSDIGSILPNPEFEGQTVRVLPSISHDIWQFENIGGMPPYGDDSNHRWMNLETPWDGIEWETFALAKNPGRMQATPEILASCQFPGSLEAHAVGVRVENSFSTDMIEWIPERLNTFNLKEGLLCLDSEQGPGQSCRNYETSYLCTSEPGEFETNVEYWTPWFDGDSPSDGVDNELRNLDEIRLVCDNPIAIKTRFFIDVTPFEIIGPSDRLARISPYGVVCNNDDQVDGQCNNYVVRYRDCVGTSEEETVTMTNAWSNTRLTAGGSGNNVAARGQPYNGSWNTQYWVIEPESNSDYVRLRNIGTRTYLNVSGQQDNAVVETYEIRDWDSQRWIVESASPYYGFRLKNVWSGKYLTMRDTSGYSSIYSQNFNPGWTSQVWRFAVD